MHELNTIEHIVYCFKKIISVLVKLKFGYHLNLFSYYIPRKFHYFVVVDPY